MAEKIILVEGKEDVDILKNQINNSESKIISFDFESHKILEKLKINHSLVEEYFSEKDEELIDNKTVELTTNWFLHPEIKEFLTFKKINLGSLLQIEIIWYFFEYLKKIIGIKRIIEKEKPQRISTSFLSECVLAVCKDKSVELDKHKSTKNTALFFDEIEIPIGIRGKIIPIKISRKNFLKTRKILAKSIDMVYNFKPKVNEMKNEKTILILDYNPVQYDNFLNSLSKSQNNILLLNQRRPAIWNYNSLQILKKSKCKIIELNDFSNDDLLKIIHDEQNKLEIQLKKLWQNNAFEKIFSVEGNSFWSAIRENFSRITTARFIETVERFFLLNALFENIDVSCILEWAHVGLEDRLIISMANKRKIPNMFLQHGLYVQNKKFDKYLPIFPILPSEGSKHLVWGEILKEHILQYKINSNDVIELGSPRHDKFFNQDNRIKNTNTILLAANGLFHNNFAGADTRAFIKMENFIKKIFEIIKKYPEKKLIIKLHPGKVSYDIKPIIKQIDPTTKIYQNENIFELLKKCDAMISLNYSTVVLDAMISKIPTLVTLPEKQFFEDEIPLKDGAVLYTKNIDELESSIELLLNDSIRQNLINKSEYFVNRYISNRGTASTKLVEILDKYGKLNGKIHQKIY